jgi:hypothetical protein
MKNWDSLKGDKATGNKAINRDAYGRMPHLFFNLAVEYGVPDELFLTILFLWDKTVGANCDDPSGHCSMTQIPVRERNARRWLAALVMCGFWDCKKSGLGDKKGSFYEYRNPSAEEWETFFRTASVLRDMAGFDNIRPEHFARIFARALGRIEGIDEKVAAQICEQITSGRKSKKNT